MNVKLYAIFADETVKHIFFHCSYYADELEYCMSMKTQQKKTHPFIIKPTLSSLHTLSLYQTHTIILVSKKKHSHFIICNSKIIT